MKGLSAISRRITQFGICLTFALLSITGFSAAAAQQAVYIGTDACSTCHAKEYRHFITYAKKAKSFESIERLKKGLSDEEIRQCYACHTTGYGRPGGFTSPEATPLLKNTGCEACHGPGSIHARTRSRSDIKHQLTMEDCEACHTGERVRAFRFKPLIHGGAH